VTRSPDLATAFSTAGSEAVAEVARAAARCADPATCGSEFEADSLTSRTVTCTRCGLQGVLDAECVSELVPGAVIELPAGKASSRG
jgi:hypothetical protein